MIDIHSHVLPGIDDGAAQLQESLEMLKVAAASGTTDIVATPHANALYPFDEQTVQRAFRTVSAEIGGRIRLHLGCEFRLEYRNLEDAIRCPRKYTINRGRYLLLELPDFIGVATLRAVIQELTRTGIVPVIAHPERNRSLQNRANELALCVKDGCFLQITGQSLLGDFGTRTKRAAEELMNANLVHFIASDAHDCLRRPPNLLLAYQHVVSRYSADFADNVFFRNPAAVLSDDRLPYSQSKPRKTFRLFSMQG